MSTIIDDVRKAFANAKELNGAYTINEEDIKFENNFEDGKNKFNSVDPFELLRECPFVVQLDYAIPLFLLVATLDGDSRNKFISDFYKKMGFRSGFFFGGTVDFVFMVHNFAILKKAGYKWNPEKAKRLSNKIIDTYDFSVEIYGDVDSFPEVFGHIFAYCTSDENQIGGCKFNNMIEDYYSDVRHYDLDENTFKVDNFSILEELFVFYGLYTEFGDYSYTYKVGDPLLIMSNEPRSRGEIINEIVSLLKELRDPKEGLYNFLSPLFLKYGITPLDRKCSPWYVLYSLSSYADRDNIDNTTMYRDIKDIANIENYSDALLLMRIGYPFIYRGRYDIINELSENFSVSTLRYYFSSLSTPGSIVEQKTLYELYFYDGKELTKPIIKATDIKDNTQKAKNLTDDRKTLIKGIISEMKDEGEKRQYDTFTRA